jgi:hypothetical protein
LFLFFVTNFKDEGEEVENGEIEEEAEIQNYYHLKTSTITISLLGIRRVRLDLAPSSQRPTFLILAKQSMLFEITRVDEGRVNEGNVLIIKANVQSDTTWPLVSTFISDELFQQFLAIP